MENKPTSSKEIIAYLAEKFPACFTLDGAAKPLKVGIFQDLTKNLAEDENVSKTRLRQALRHYTSSWRYLKSIKLGTFRIDLEGNNAEEIDQAQADYALKTLKESQDKFSNKKPKDNNAKKSYKGGAKDVSKEANTTAKADQKQSQKFSSVKSSKKTVSKPVAPLKPVDSTALKVGQSVKVQVANAPLNATITEIAGTDISVQLDSGMVVKTRIQNIYSQ